MATSSYANLFGTTGAGQQGSKAGIGTLFGQQAAPQMSEEERRQRQQQQQAQPQQTFAQLQKQGMARPAPQAPQGQPFQQFGGSQQAQAARTGMLSQLQQQLAQPTRFDTQAFQQIRQAQSAQLGAEYQAQQAQLNEELARRGLSASSIGGGRMGDLAGQQARALAQLDAQLLQQAAQTQAQDRLAAMQAAQGFAELAGAQDLAQFEANRVAQAAQFQQALQGAQFEQGQTEFERQQALAAAQAQQAGGFQEMELGLRRQLGLGELGLGERRQAAQETQFGQSLAEQIAARQQQFGLSGRELDLRAQQIQQEGALQGRQLTIEEARLQAQQQQFAQTQAQQAAQFGVTTQLEQQRLAAQQQQFGAQLGFNREELALRGELGRNEQQLAEQRLSQEGRLEEARQAIQVKQMGQQDAQFQATLGAEEQRFVRTLKEQQDARLQQLGVSTRELDLRAQQIKDEARLRGEEISNTKARDTAEIEYRGKALEQQATLAGQQITAEEARQNAQLQFQRDQMAVEKTLRESGIAVDRERITSAESQFTKQLAETTAGRQQQATQFAITQAQQTAEARSRQTGLSFIVNSKGEVVEDRDPTTGKQLTTMEGQQLKQQAADALAERELRDKLQKVQLTSQEKIALDDIVARKEMQAQQLAQQAAEAGGLVRVGFEETTDSNGNIKRIPIFKTTVQAQQLAQQAADATAERGLREAMLIRELNSQEKRALDEITLRKQQLAQQAAEVAGKVQVGTRTITREDGSKIEEPIYGETVQAQQLAAQTEQARLDRALRQQLGLAELTGQITTGEGEDAQTRATLAAQQFNLGAQQQYFAQQQARQQLLVQLAAGLAQSTNIPAAELSKLIKDLQDRLLNPTVYQQQQGGMDLNSQEFQDWLKTLGQQYGARG